MQSWFQYRCKLVCSSFGVLAGQLAHKRTLSHRGETNEADTGNTSTSNIEPDTSTATAATTWLEKLPLKFCEFRLQLP
jgi:hypothetical protein